MSKVDLGKKIIYQAVTKKVTVARWQLNLFGLSCVLTGFLVALTYFSYPYLSKIFATAQSSISKDTDTDFNQGTLTTAVVSGSSTSAVVTLNAGSLTAEPWCNSSGTCDNNWPYRRKITFDNSGQAENLTNFPVLIKLDSGTDIDYSKTMDSGQDIRFADADGTTLLNYEIEKWDETGSSYVWVNVPQIDASSNSDFIYMYYGNGSASDNQSVANTWNANFASVWHLNNNPAGAAPAIRNSSSNAYHGYMQGGMIAGSLEAGRIGDALNFDGNNDYVNVPYNTATNINFTPTSQDFTMEAWVKYNSDGTANVVGKAYNNGGHYELYVQSRTLRARVGSNTNVDSGVTVANGEWHHIALVNNSTTDRFSFVVDGVLDNTLGVSGANAYNYDFIFGARRGNNNTNAANFLAGLIDEVRVSNVARSTDWLKATYLNGTDAFANFGSEQNKLSSGTWESPTDSNVYDMVWNGGWGDGTDGSTAFSATVADVSADATIQFQMRVASTALGLASASYVDLGTVNTGTDFTKTKAELDALGLATGSSRYIQVKATLTSVNGIANPQLDNFTIYYLSDNTAPESNASSLAMKRQAGGLDVSSDTSSNYNWTNDLAPYFSWTAGSDSESGLKGYCLYLGTDSNGNPATSKGLLGTSPISTTGTTCQFIVNATSIDFATTAYRGSTWLTSSSSPYYFKIKAIDTTNNISASAVSFEFKFDNTTPTNVTYLSASAGPFPSLSSMFFTWPTSGSAAASDANSGILGWQYAVNNTDNWIGTTTDSTLGISYMPIDEAQPYYLSDARDGSYVIIGNNIIYFRVIDKAGNISPGATYKTVSIAYGGNAPTFPGDGAVTITATTPLSESSPSASATNHFAISWDAALAGTGRTIAKYYYMINTTPPQTLATLENNSATYFATTSTSVSAAALPQVNRGSNEVYVVAVDDADNYASGNYLRGTFTLNSDLPDAPRNVAVTDASVKSASLWRGSIVWDVPTYKGTGTLTYTVQRSTDGSTWSTVGTTSGTAYVDTVPESKTYYWRVGASDTTNDSVASPTYSNGVSVWPKGKFTEAASLSSGPSVSNITTKKAKISWSTGRSSDSKVAYGLKTGDYYTDEPSNSSQVTDHTITLTNLSPGTTYYYKTKWTDEDGNTGTSDEKSFTTEAAPTVTDPTAKTIGISNVTLQYTVKGASKVKIYYGKTTDYGSTKEVATSTEESTYTTLIEGLEDGTKYYYKINTFDSDGNEYDSNSLSFTTMPRPKISGVQIQQVRDTAQPTVLVTWSTNTDTSSIVTYYPEGDPSKARDEVNVALVKGEHRIIIRALLSETGYILQVRGRDRAGNEALSDTQKFTTATDTRAPLISDLRVEAAPMNSGESNNAQLIVSWTTDEPSTSQVEYGEGTGNSYAFKTQEDSNLTLNHLVVISNLTPSKVYHLRAVSKDKAGNPRPSSDNVTITSKATDNALDLVITNLTEAFGFLRGLNQ